MSKPRIAIVGGGPAGLMAAEAAASAGAEVTVFDAMPSLARKLLMAGKSGLNITHDEPQERFMGRYGQARPHLASALGAFNAAALRDWCTELGIETFVGSSGRVFPTSMKASPLLRAWLQRLGRSGVVFRPRHRWIGWQDDALLFETPEGQVSEGGDAVVLALGGASWPRLGSDARWVPWLVEKGVPVDQFRPANCGFEVAWSSTFADRFAGAPVKAVTAKSAAGILPGEFVVTQWGVEGSLVYAHAAALRDELESSGRAALVLDLVPGRSAERLARDLARQPAKASFSNRLRKGAGLDPVKLGLLRECVEDPGALDPAGLAERLKALPLSLTKPRPIEQAISSAGGVSWSGVETNFMLAGLPGVFVAGEMLDWEAPTGGYLLTACWATGRAAGLAAARYAADQVRAE
ncbi:TIGR03862 family flavoprotein [Devosia sp. PTR5]|uniref:TIGR03862 family flavoprotein n=1 Tax=Devosia oryzisoli TaxID=2774138 RepID=A0A927FZH1_9HYPH|nr:TIGR03862 family flavoprotein [Devosia oryzisoli]